MENIVKIIKNKPIHIRNEKENCTTVDASPIYFITQFEEETEIVISNNMLKNTKPGCEECKFFKICQKMGNNKNTKKSLELINNFYFNYPCKKEQI